MRTSKRIRAIFPSIVIFALAAVAFLAFPKEARAQRELLVPAGGKGQLVIDQISGFRVSSIGAVSYAGPVGLSYQHVSVDQFNAPGSTTTSAFTFYVAPSADYFVIDHLSVGGLIMFSTTSSSVEIPNGNGNGSTSQSLPSTNDFTILPRVGYLIPLGNDRFGIWPRLGLGYASHQEVQNAGTAANPTKTTLSGLLVDLDVGFFYRFNETFFIRLAPELSFSMFGSNAVNNGPTTQSVDARFFQFGIATGIGVMFNP